VLEIDVAMEETFDETTKEFGKSDVHHVVLEHSLVSLSKWESLWEVPFLAKTDKTTDQTISYVKMMILGDELSPEVFTELLRMHLKIITEYVGAKMTATTIKEIKSGASRNQVVTSELIYSWMVAMRIPFSAETWHLNRLITLIRVMNAQNAPKKKMTMAERAALNRQRLAQHGTRG
jgi:hypothetical protein